MTHDPASDEAGSRSRYRLFLSSPTDVEAEREAVRRVVERINADRPDRTTFELIRWEDVYYTAGSTFQHQIPTSAECDLVVCVFWKRLGSDLPETYRRPDGTLPTGTEFEFEEALQAATRTPGKVPDILVYRNMAEVTFSEANLELERAQRDRFLAFWNRWFRNEQGHFVAGFQHYRELAEFERLIELHLRQWLARHDDEASWTRGSPFRGLKPFEMEDAPIFFGRGRETERIRARFIANALSGAGFLVICGASGAGKSSLARAGLLARMAGPGGMGNIAGFVRVAAVTPFALAANRHWSRGLAEALLCEDALGPGLSLGDFGSAELLAGLLARGGVEARAPLIGALERMKQADPEVARRAGASAGAFILLLDQLEEIFTWPRETSEAFLACIEALAGSAAPIFVIATLRSDFRHRLGEFEALERLAALRAPLGPGEHERIVEIGKPGGADLREMIEGPARIAGLDYERNGDRHLQTAIETEASADSLPALQLLLSELYERRRDKTLLLEEHDRLGGVGGVMAARGEEVLDAIGPQDAAAFPGLVRLLVGFGSPEAPPTARRIALSALGEATPQARLAMALRDASLLTSDNGQLRIAHESLIGGWARLSDILRDERRLFEVRERLDAMSRRWSEIQAAESRSRRRRLLTGFPLEEGRDLLAKWGEQILSATAPDLPAFIAASDRRDRARRRIFLLSLGATAAVIAAIATVAVWFRAESETAARSAEVRLHLARAESALRERNWDAAVAISGHALALEDSPETRSMAYAALSEHSPYFERLVGHGVVDGKWTRPGELSLLESSGALSVIDGAAQPPDAKRVGGQVEGRVEGLAAAYHSIWPDGREGAVAVANDGALSRVAAGAVAEAAGQAAEAPSTGHILTFTHQVDLRVTAQGVTVVVADLFSGALLRTCTLETGFTCVETPLSGPAPVAALSPDGREVAVVHADTGSPRLVVLRLAEQGPPVETGSMALPELETLNSPLSLGWSHDGGWIALGTRSGAIALADMSTSTMRRAATIDAGTAVTNLAWSPQSPLLAFACQERAICLARVGEGGDPSERPSLQGSHASISRLAWSPDGEDMLSIHSDGQARLWRVSPEQPVIAVLAAQDPASFTSIASEPALGRIAAGDEKGVIHVWDDENAGQVLPAGPANMEPVVHLAFADDGSLAAVHRDGTVVIRTGAGLGVERTEHIGGMNQRLAWIGDAVAASRAAPDVTLIARGAPVRVFASAPDAALADGVAGRPDGAGFVTSHPDGSVRQWTLEGEPAILLSAATVADMRSALSLALHPGGRWLAATRSDEQVKLYDLDGTFPPVSLPLYRRDTKVVAFSPDGARFAALGSDARLYVWKFDAANGATGLLISVPAVPQTAGLRRNRMDGRRPASWMAWRDSRHIAIATTFGEVLTLDLDEHAWRRRLDALSHLASP